MIVKNSIPISPSTKLGGCRRHITPELFNAFFFIFLFCFNYPKNIILRFIIITKNYDITPLISRTHFDGIFYFNLVFRIFLNIKKDTTVFLSDIFFGGFFTHFSGYKTLDFTFINNYFLHINSPSIYIFPTFREDTRHISLNVFCYTNFYLQVEVRFWPYSEYYYFSHYDLLYLCF